MTVPSTTKSHPLILSIKDLQVHYGAIQAIKGLSFDVAEGEIFSLIGSNGAGKSTILRAISGLLKSSKGQIHFFRDGKQVDLSRLRPEKIVELGIAHAPEGRGIFPNLTVEENLKLGAYLRNDCQFEEEFEAVFKLFPRVKERLWQSAGTLSGGEQQMVAIGRSLMAKPKLLLLDEPSLGLAPQIIERIFEIIVQVNQQGVTVLLVEQNAMAALEIAHRAIVLETGKLTHSGKASDLLQSNDIQAAYLGF